MQIINQYDYFIITSCKEDDNMTSLKKYLADYLVIQERDVDDSILYQHLLKVLFDIYTPEEIKHIMENAIPKLCYYIPLEQKRGLVFHDFINLFYYQLLNLDILKHEEAEINGEITIVIKDLYSVLDNKKLIPFSEYRNYLEKEKRHYKVKKLN